MSKMTGDKKHIMRIAGACGGVALAFAIALAMPSEMLGTQGTYVFAILCGAIVWWICGVLPEFITAILMSLLFVLVANVRPQTVFSFFSTGLFWLFVGAYSIGLGMRETGLLARMALAIVSKFPSSFAAQVMGFFACGTIVSPLIPSMAAKLSLLVPLSMEVSEMLGYKNKGREANGLFLAVFTGVLNTCPLVISASVIGYALYGLYPADIQAQFGFFGWFVAALPWFVPMTALNLVSIILLYRPRKTRDSVRTQKANSVDGLREELMRRRAQLGPMSSAEKRMVIISLATVLFWMTESIHGIDAWIVAVGSLVAMSACGIVNSRNFSQLGWSSLIFIGIVLGLGDVFTEAGISDWIVATLAPSLAELAANPFLFMAGIALVTVASRFILVSQTAFINIFMVFAIPIATSVGINPWVVGMASLVAINPWFVKYQNPVYLAAYYSMEGKMVKHGSMAAYCVLYTLLALVSLMIAVPFWLAMGLF